MRMAAKLEADIAKGLSKADAMKKAKKWLEYLQKQKKIPKGKGLAKTHLDDIGKYLDDADAIRMGIDPKKFAALPLLRQQYLRAVYSLKSKADAMKKTGKSLEEIARAMHAERRALGVQYKNLTPPKLLTSIYARNLKKYQDKLGPTIKWLRERGKSGEEIIESATRVGGADLGF